MGRPIGKNIRKLVSILEEAKGRAMSVSEIQQEYPLDMLPPVKALTAHDQYHERSSYIRVYIRRAQAYGVIKVVSENPLRWGLAVGYEAKLERNRPQAAYKHRIKLPTGPNSVFDLAR